MSRFCPHCGSEVAPGRAFCTECGCRIPESRGVVSPQAPYGQGGSGAVVILIITGIVVLSFMAVFAAAFVGGFLHGMADPGTGPDDPGITTPPTVQPSTLAPTPVQSTAPRATAAVTQKATAGTLKITTVPTTVASSEKIYRDYSWKYDGTGWTWSGWFTKDGYEYYRNKAHNRDNNYAGYALSDYDRALIKNIVDNFREGGDERGYTDTENAMNIVAFVQSLPYTSDKVTTGFDEYPRYPIETLVDNGGDCEDTSILAAALINEMGYGVVLIRLPGHMAIGIKGSDDIDGTYYEYKGSRYYYLETTGTGWELGEVPDEYAGKQATIFPLVQVPLMSMECNTKSTGSDFGYVYLQTHCDIENIGVGTAKSPVLYTAALALDEGEDLVWEPDAEVALDDYAEGATGYAEAGLKIPRDKRTQIKYVLSGDNFRSVELLTKEFTT